MNTIAPLLRPVAKLWNDLTHDEHFQDLNLVKGGYHNKATRAEFQKVNHEFKCLYRQMYEKPSLLDTLSSNVARFTLLGFVERWVTMRQATQGLQLRNFLGNTNAGALNVIAREGLVLGAMRGNLLHLLHFTGVHYHAAYFADQSFTKYILYSNLFELFFYPVDTLKTLMQANVQKQYTSVFNCLLQTIQSRGLSHLYSGITYKLAFNVAFGYNLWNLYSDNHTGLWLSFPLLVLAYPLLAAKTQLQVFGTQIGLPVEFSINRFFNETTANGRFIKGLYPGLLPFLFMTYVFGINLPGVYSEKKKKAELDRVCENIPITHEQYNERRWV